MVIIWGSGLGPRRRRRPGYGYGPAYGWGRRRGHGPGYGHGYGRGHRRDDDSCLRDLLLLNTGCCLANAVGCGADSFLVAPTTLRHVAAAGTGGSGTPVARRLVAAVRVYQREISPRRPPVCRFEPMVNGYHHLAVLKRQDALAAIAGRGPATTTTAATTEGEVDRAG